MSCLAMEGKSLEKTVWRFPARQEQEAVESTTCELVDGTCMILTGSGSCDHVAAASSPGNLTQLLQICNVSVNTLRGLCPNG